MVLLFMVTQYIIYSVIQAFNYTCVYLFIYLISALKTRRSFPNLTEWCRRSQYFWRWSSRFCSRWCDCRCYWSDTFELGLRLNNLSTEAHTASFKLVIRMLSWRIRNKTYKTITQYIPFHSIHKHTFSNFLHSLFLESLLHETLPSGLVFCVHFVVTTFVYSDIFFVSSVFYLLATHCFYVSSSKCFPCLQLLETSAHVMQSFLAFFICVYCCILSTSGDVRRGVVSKIHQAHHLIGFFILSFSNPSVIICSVYSVIQFL